MLSLKRKVSLRCYVRICTVKWENVNRRWFPRSITGNSVLVANSPMANTTPSSWHWQLKTPLGLRGMNRDSGLWGDDVVVFKLYRPLLRYRSCREFISWGLDYCAVSYVSHYSTLSVLRASQQETQLTSCCRYYEVKLTGVKGTMENLNVMMHSWKVNVLDGYIA